MEAHTFWAGSWWSSTPGTLASSGHQPGILCTHALQVTYISYSSTGGSGEDLFLTSSSELPANSWRKWLTSGPNSGRASRSKSRRGGLASLSPPRSWTPPGRAVFKGRGRAFLRLHPAVPPVSSMRSSSAVIPTPRVGTEVWPALGDGLAQLLYFLLQGGCSSQGLPVGFPHLSKVPLSRGVPPPPPGGFALRRLDISWTRLLYLSQWFAPFLPQVVFQGECYLSSQFLHLFQPP